jgi:hypothetical protein
LRQGLISALIESNLDMFFIVKYSGLKCLASCSLENSDLNRIFFSRFLAHNLATASKTNREQYCLKIRRSCQIEEVKSKFSTAHKEMNRIFVKFDTTPWLCMSI